LLSNKRGKTVRGTAKIPLLVKKSENKPLKLLASEFGGCGVEVGRGKKIK
jgi:hypothetical protein